MLGQLIDRDGRVYATVGDDFRIKRDIHTEAIEAKIAELIALVEAVPGSIIFYNCTTIGAKRTIQFRC